MANVLVLGADGFLGSHLTMSLLKKHNVSVLDKFRHGRLSTHLEIEKFEGDYTNIPFLKKALEGKEYVFNFVSSSSPAASLNDPFSDILKLQSSVLFLKCCVEAGVKKVIYPSTGGAIYGRCSKKPFKETDPVSPISPYAINKLAFENYLGYYKNTFNLDFVIYRISNPYGPLQNISGAQGIIPIFLNNIKNNIPLTVYGDGSMTRDYIYITDTVKMISDTFEISRESVYNLGSGLSHSVNDIIYEISSVVKKPVQIDYKPMRQTDIKNVTLDMSRFKNEFKTEAGTNLREGIYHTWNYVSNLTS